VSWHESGICGVVSRSCLCDWRFQAIGLVGTTRDDVEVVADYFMPMPRNREIRILLVT